MTEQPSRVTRLLAGTRSRESGEDSLQVLADQLLADVQGHVASARRLADAADRADPTGRRSAAPGPGGGASPTDSLARGSSELAAGAEKLRQAAFAMDLRLKLAKSTNTYRPWQQIPAWCLGVAGISFAFYLASKEYEATGGWLTAALILVLAVVAMFRGPADISLGTGGGSDTPGSTTREEAEPSAESTTAPTAPIHDGSGGAERRGSPRPAPEDGR